MNEKNVLVLGATGAMGRYLVPLLCELGYHVDAISWDHMPSNHPNLNYFQLDAQNNDSLTPFLKRHYDGIVDFLIYPTATLAYRLPWIVQFTEHYIYLSSYRVYDNREIPIRETSPRILDATDNPILRNSDDYSVFKARGENMLQALPRKNWTIVRPAITYSIMRYQLVTLEAANTVGRAQQGKKVPVPIQAKDHQATMSWAGDVAAMLARLLFNPQALGEAFTLATAEHHTWETIADYYREICNLQPVWVDQEDYLRMLGNGTVNIHGRWQLEYDRLFDRIIDNQKVLQATGMHQSDLMPLYQGLEQEIARCPKQTTWEVNQTMDHYLNLQA